MDEVVTVHQLAGGDHACLTFSDPEERLDLVAEFVIGGLEAGQRVIWLTDRMMSRIGDDLDRALRDGFTGLRVTADMRWAIGPVVAAEQLLAFEKQASLILDSEQLTVMCQYDREVFDSVMLAFAAGAHSKTVAAEAYYDTPLLRICRQYRPPGIRIAGEIDYSQLAALQQALSEALRLDETIHVNLYRLQFIDITAATAIAKAALNLPPGREMIVECSEMVAAVVETVGARQAPQLSIRSGP